MTGYAKVKLIGIFKNAYGSDRIPLRMDRKERLGDVIQRIVESSPELGRVLVDPELGDPRPNSAILVNGKEISVLKGLETEVGSNDEIVFLPVTHGG